MEYSFNIELAQKLGLYEAIFLKNIGFWIAKNGNNNKHYYDGYYWTYNSISAFKELFPFWNDRQIHHIIQKLLKKGIIKKGNYNKIGYDRTLWYTIIDKKIFNICVKPILQKCKMEESKKENPIDNNVKPIPYNKPYNKPDKKEKPIKHKYGEYKNVLLNDDQHNRLLKELGKEELDYWIKKVDTYVAKSGKKYSNFLAVIKDWRGSNEKGSGSTASNFEKAGKKIRENQGQGQEQLSTTSTEIKV